jgi:Hemerythrin HHE cation binding domain
MTQSPSPDEVTALLTTQHEHIKGLMTNVRNDRPDEREATFNEFRCFLAAHEAAEEHAMHPVATQELADSHLARRRIAEEEAAGAMIAELETLDHASDEFSAKFDALTGAVIAHAEAEEHNELPDLLATVTADELVRIHAALARVNALADLNARHERSSFAEMLTASEAALSGA